MKENALLIIVLALIIISVIVVIIIVVDYLKEPFAYPVIKHDIDLSGRKKPSYDECIDQWIIDHQEYDFLDNYNTVINEWDVDCKRYLNKTLLWRKHKTKIYNEIREQITAKDYEIFKFVFFRSQTRYRQVNYQKIQYTVDNIDKVLYLTLQQLLEIDDELEEIDYETTRDKYFAKNQRKLMTKELRKKIILRDNYTCQNCGKYMPDEVGLHVDHIIAIKNGGKTVESNLQVLCDKCNLRKGKK